MRLEHLLEPASVAVVGASSRPGSFGARLVTEVSRSPRVPEISLVNARLAGERIGGRPVVASLEEVDGAVDLVLVAVGDGQLEAVLSTAARRGDRAAVIYGSAVDPTSPADSSRFRARLAAIAREAGMALCGGGCMGFVSPSVRAIGYLERHPLPNGPVALVTHSGSAFSALLRADRPFGWSLAVSSGQELVTTAAEYLEYALALGSTGVVVLVLEAVRDADRLRAALDLARERDVPVVALAVGASEAGRAMVAAHSGALAGSDAAWEALADAHGVLRVEDLAELCDTVELLVARRRAPARREGAGGIGAVFDSGAERALAVDLGARLGVGFAELEPGTAKRLAELLDPGLDPSNPLDVWGTGARTEEVFREALRALAGDAGVDAVALAVDLVPEYDGDESYRTALVAAWEETELPLCIMSHVPSALDREAAARLRRLGIPVLEGTRSGLLALRHLLELRDFAGRAPLLAPAIDEARATRAALLASGGDDPLAALELLAQYGIAAPATRVACDREGAVAAAGKIGFPVAMKTAAPIAHKSDVGGVMLHLDGPTAVGEAYDRLARLGKRVTVAAMAPEGVELSLGVVRDPALGPLVVVGAGGGLVELLADRVVALPPLDRPAAGRLLRRLRAYRLLEGYRGRPGADLGAVEEAVVAVSLIALEAGESLEAFEINPLSCGPAGALALDVLVEARRPG
ncbi:MAG TPA: acetate--CoA ligase family protein [Acidimicrobiales bacterium]|nr:acetate--CoA ligase family protein [Acidimicrobiales bacterium]